MTEKQIQIKLIRAYYGLSYQEAKAKIVELEANHQLETILKLALEQDRMDCPPCPQCGGEMKARNGKNGPFFGCLAYPKCRGTRARISDLVEITTDQKKEAAKKLTIALNYIQEIGGADSARHWLHIAAQSLGEGIDVSPPANARISDRLRRENTQPEVDIAEGSRSENLYEPGSNSE